MRVPTELTAVTVPTWTFLPFFGTGTNTDAKPLFSSVIAEAVLRHWLKVAVLVFGLATAEAPGSRAIAATLAQASKASRPQPFFVISFSLSVVGRPTRVG